MNNACIMLAGNVTTQNYMYSLQWQWQTHRNILTTCIHSH